MTRAEKIDTIITKNKKNIVDENTNKPEEKTENKSHLDYSENTRIITIEIIDTLLQEVVQQEQLETTDQTTKTTIQSEKLEK